MLPIVRLLKCKLQGLRPLPPTRRFPGFLDFSIFRKNVELENFPMGFGVWEGLQRIGNVCGLQMDGFSGHFEPSESSFNDFHDFGNFAVVSDGLICSRKVPGPSETALKVPEPCESITVG